MHLDCYVLSPVRSASVVLAFLDRFLPRHEPSYERDDPHQVLGLAAGASFDEVLRFLERHLDRKYTFYWRNSEHSDPLHGMAAFNADGSLVLGLSIGTDSNARTNPDPVARPWLERMCLVTAARKVAWGLELPPPTNARRFSADLVPRGS